jgi:hypothetical protein
MKFHVGTRLCSFYWLQLKGMEKQIKSVIEKYGDDACDWNQARRNYDVSSWRQEVIQGLPEQQDGYVDRTIHYLILSL